MSKLSKVMTYDETYHPEKKDYSLYKQKIVYPMHSMGTPN